MLTATRFPVKKKPLPKQPLPAAAEPTRRAGLLAAAILVLAAIAAYHNTLSVPFFFDDVTAIEENQSIRDLSRLGTVLSPPRDGSAVTGRPMINLSFAFNYALGGTHPFGYHVLNLALHAAAALALFGLIRRTLLLPVAREKFGPHATSIAFVAALCWTVHPLQTESVTCVAQRTEVLVGVFYLLTLYAFARSTEEGSGWRWTAVAVTACLLGVGSKEVMVSAPLLALLYDRTFVAGTFAEVWRRRRLVHLGLFASWLPLAVLVAGGGGSRGAAAGFGLGITWWSYALKQCEAIILYLKLSVWPWPLVLDYGTDVVSSPLQVLPQGLALIALVTATVTALWRRPVFGFFGMWFFAILAPSSSVVPLVSQTMAEHRMYLPLAAITTAATVGLYLWAGRRALGFLLAASLALGAVTVRRNHDYRSEEAIWTVTIAQRPENARAYSNLGNALKAQGRHEEAARSYTEASRRGPEGVEAMNNLAAIHIEGGRHAEAQPLLENVLRLKPDFPDALNNLGSVYAHSGRAKEALALFESAVRLKPHLVPARSNLAGSLLTAGRVDEAIAQARAALDLNPRFSDALVHLANALLTSGKPTDAIPYYEAALPSRPRDAEVRCNLGSAHYRLGRPEKAIPQYEDALRLNPHHIDAHNNLASALFQTGRPAEAVGHYREAIRLAPDGIEARANLALVLARLGRIAEAIAELEELLRRHPDNKPARDTLVQLQAAPR